MNFKLGVFANEAYFWAVLAAMVAVAVVTVAVARVRHWI
jgi:hypothetical protein